MEDMTSLELATAPELIEELHKRDRFMGITIISDGDGVRCLFSNINKENVIALFRDLAQQLEEEEITKET